VDDYASRLDHGLCRRDGRRRRRERRRRGRPHVRPGERYETDDGRTIAVGEPAVNPTVVTVEFVSSTHYYERIAVAESGQYVSFTVTVEGSTSRPRTGDCTRTRSACH